MGRSHLIGWPSVSQAYPLLSASPPGPRPLLMGTCKLLYPCWVTGTERSRWNSKNQKTEESCHFYFSIYNSPKLAWARENREGRVRIDCLCIANDAKLRVVDVAQSLRPRGQGKRAGGEMEEPRRAALPWRGGGSRRSNTKWRCCISRSIMQGTWATNQLPVGTPTGNLRRESGNSRRSLGRELTLITSPSHPMDGNAWRSTGQGCNSQVLLAGCGQRGIPRLTPCTMTGGRSGSAPERQDNPFEKGCHIIRS